MDARDQQRKDDLVRALRELADAAAKPADALIGMRFEAVAQLHAEMVARKRELFEEGIRMERTAELIQATGTPGSLTEIQLKAVATVTKLELDAIMTADAARSVPEST